MRVDVEGHQFDVPDDATTAEIDSLTQPAPSPPSGIDKLANGPPSTLGLIRQGADWLSGKQAEADQRTAQEHPAEAPYLKLFSVLGGMGAGAGLSRGGTVLPKSMSASENPVLQQIRRVNAVSGSEPSGGLPALPKVLDWVLPGKLTKTYEFLRKARQRPMPSTPESPYPAEAGGEGSQWRPAGPAPEQAPAPLTPELQAAAEASRARVLSRIAPEPATRVASPQMAPAQQTAPQFDSAFRDARTGRVIRTGPYHDIGALPGGSAGLADLSENGWQSGFVDRRTGRFLDRNEAAKSVFGNNLDGPLDSGDLLARPEMARDLYGTTPTQPATATSTLSPFEAAGRAKKVAELTKAIDANASAHLGVDPQDPRFGEALAGLPPEWWEGMGQVAKVNKPSPQTISEVLKFYQDRASQRGSVLPLSRSQP